MKILFFKKSSFIVMILSLTSCGGGVVKNPQALRSQASVNDITSDSKMVWPKVFSLIKKDDVMEAEISAIVGNMTLAEKIGQMTQPEIQSITLDDIREYHFGSVLNGGGSWPLKNKMASINDWVNHAELLYQASIDTSKGGQGIPLIWGIDAVHGNNNVLGATLYPHNIALGATHNPELIKAIGAATAVEVAATGIDWAFAPTIAVVRNDRWGRTYEGYSEDPEIVQSYAKKMIEGLQGDASTSKLFSDEHVIATAKHFIGDGGTHNGINEGNNLASEQDLFNIHAQGYYQALEAGAQTVMASYSSWQGLKMHGSEYLLTNVLKEQMGFDGLVISDWDGIAQVPGCRKDHCPQAINSGVDMIMVPTDWKKFIENTINDVESGAISENRINDAVSRILRVKKRAHLFTKASPRKRKLAGNKVQFGSTKHRALARMAVRESIVLLKNKTNLLPLKRKLNVLVVGDGADNISKQSGGWSMTWQGDENKNSDFPGATSIYQGIKKIVTTAGGTANLSVDGTFEGSTPDVAIVVYGENPYAETKGDLIQLEYQAGNKSDLALLKKLQALKIPVVSVFLSGRPLWVNKELNASDAFIAAWLPGTEGAGIADVIFKNSEGQIHNDFVGKLSYSWPKSKDQFLLNRFDTQYSPLFPYGYGLTYKNHDVLSSELPEE
jgi:beta-glucosidase